MDAAEWRQQRRFATEGFERDVLDRRGERVSVCIPARNAAETLPGVLAPIVALLGAGAIDQVAVVVNGANRDDTAKAALEAGAEVIRAEEQLSHVGPVEGKGDAVWRAIGALVGDVIVLLDADLEGVDDRYVRGLAGPLLAESSIQLVKGNFVRPLTASGIPTPYGAGRVTELTARPLLSVFYPELAALGQPLSGQVGVRRSWLASLPIWTGYGLEIGMLLETWKRVGLDGIAEVDLGTLLNRHQPLSDLGLMAHAVLLALCRQLEREGRLQPVDSPALIGQSSASQVPVSERPPFASQGSREVGTT